MRWRDKWQDKVMDCCDKQYSRTTADVRLPRHLGSLGDFPAKE